MVTARILKLGNLLWMASLLSVAWERHGKSLGSVAAFFPVQPHTPLGRRRVPQQPLAVAVARSQLTVASKNKKPGSPTKTRLVIVESPAKCDTIAKILNEENPEDPSVYEVISCRGHVRNLSSKKADSPLPPDFPYPIPGVDLANSYSPLYEILPDKVGVVGELKKAAAQASEVLLATDADREGEAMAWHLTQVLGDRHRYKRVSFVELTPTAIREAIKNPYDLNPHLVAAQETRRVLDRLAGYTVSPVLWKKVSPGLSAGRVQSAGMALLVQRERERLLFPETPYWKIAAEFCEDKQCRTVSPVYFNLYSLNETIVLAAKSNDFAVETLSEFSAVASTDKMHLDTEDRTLELVSQLTDPTTAWRVMSVTSQRRTQTAPPPYITSSLQQDAYRGLGWGVSQTMRVAQQLYEKGLITYMRTDSSSLSRDADTALKQTLRDKYYSSTRSVNSKSKNRRKDTKFAQEAHEAIRPAILNGGFVPASDMQLDEPCRRLYRMIFQRTLASSMAPRVINTTRVVVQGLSRFGSAEFVKTGNVEVEPGYAQAYTMDEENDAGGGLDMEEQSISPLFHEGQVLCLRKLCTSQHVTHPPARFTEASFVQQLESLGVGRPSTYAKTIQVLADRGYVFSDDSRSRRSSSASGGMIPARRASGLVVDPIGSSSGRGGSLVPTLSAFVVTSLLEKHCSSLVDPTFTASMEYHLDRIAGGGRRLEQAIEDADETSGDVDRVQYLDAFYAGPRGLAARIKQIEDEVKGEEARQVILPSLDPTANESSRVGLFVGPWGPYVQRLPSEHDSPGDDKVQTAPLPLEMSANLSLISAESLCFVLSARRSGGVVLGQHPEDGRDIRFKTGRFGPYLQWGDDGDDSTTSHSLPKGTESVGNGSISLEEAVGYVSLPRTVCYFDNQPILVSLGPYGPYLKYNGSFVGLKKGDGDVLSIAPDSAIRLVRDRIENKRTRKAYGVVAELGVMEGSLVRVKSGRFGMYINWKKVNARIPTQYSESPQSLSLDDAWTILQEQMTGAKASKSPGNQNRVRTKRRKSSYQYFCEEMRPRLSSNITSLGNASKELSRLWAETVNRSHYVALAAADHNHYEHGNAGICQCKSPSGLKPDATHGQFVKARGRPSVTQVRTPSAYLLFCQESRPGLLTEDGRKPSFAESSRLLANMWKGCDFPTKERFQKRAQEEKKRGTLHARGE